jgi:ribosomal protein S18 acetylase RimI-like enzyme
MINPNDIEIRRLNENDFGLLANYLADLSEKTRQRFAPHSFLQLDLEAYYADFQINIGYVGLYESKIIAYSIIKLGYLPKDFQRFQSYGILLPESEVCTFAPSVADAWQGKGMGEKIFHFICQDLSDLPLQWMILWGGVQSSNQNALKYYQKLGFQTVGCFERAGVANQDMLFRLTKA